MPDHNQQAREDLHKLAESFLKGKVKEDPAISKKDREEFHRLIDEAADQNSRNHKKPQ
jgi:hypothetical protein